MKDPCLVGLCFVKRGGALTHKHFKMVVKGNFNSLPMLNKKSRLLWGGMQIHAWGTLKFIRNYKMRDYISFLGRMGYCVKDNGEEHFEFVHHNVSIDDMNEGKMEYAKFGKLRL